MQLVSSRIWTRVAVSISFDDNHYTTGSSISLDNSPKVKVIMWLEFELAYLEAIVQYFHHYAFSIYLLIYLTKLSRLAL